MIGLLGVLGLAHAAPIISSVAVSSLAEGSAGTFRVSYTAVNLGDLDAHFSAGAEVSVEQLVASGLLSGRREPYKILGQGSLSKALQVHAPQFSASARAAIETAGGSCVDGQAIDMRAILHRRKRRS